MPLKVFVSVGLHTYIHSYVHTCIHTYIHTYIHVYTWKYINTSIKNTDRHTCVCTYFIKYEFRNHWEVRESVGDLAARRVR